jgi:hypothetical protein
MNVAIVGILAILIGLVACLAGYAVFRFVLPVLGFLVGMGLGAQLAASLFDQPYLASPLSWIMAVVVGLVVATIAFVWWYVSVALTIAGLGYAIGYGAAIALDLTATGAIIAGVVLAVVFALAAIILRVPIGVVIVVTAFWGASALIGGALILMDRLEPYQLRNGTVDVVINGSPLLLAVWIGLGIVGVLVQWMTTPREEQPLTGEPAV